MPKRYYSNESEIILLGCCILDPTLVDIAVSRGIDRQHFYDTTHQEIYLMLVKMRQGNISIDSLTLMDALVSDNEQFNKVGLLEIERIVETTNSFDHALERLLALHTQYMIANEIETMIREVNSSQPSWSVFVENIVEPLNKTQSYLTHNKLDGKDDIDTLQMEVVNIMNNNPDRRTRILTGIRSFDEKTQGMMDDEYVILASLPSRGKTSFMNQTALHSAQRGLNVLMFSLEMSSKHIKRNIATIRSQVSNWNLGRELRENIQKYYKGLEDIKPLIDNKLFIYDRRDCDTLESIEAKCRMMSSKLGRIDLICIDYIQLIRLAGRYLPEYELLGEVSPRLQGLQKNMECTLLGLAQFNRGAVSTTNEDHWPRMSNLRGSGQLEQDGDMIILNHRPPQRYSEASHNFDGIDQTDRGLNTYHHAMIIDKRRSGPVGVVPLEFKATTTTFKEI
jgi:replicative DNA helicase